MKRHLPLLFLLSLSALAPRPACAHVRNYLFNYGWYTLERGRSELELYNDYLRPTVSRKDGAAWANETEFEYGVTNRYSLGLYADFLEHAGFTSFKMENRYRFGAKDEWPADVAGYLELRKASGDLDTDELEGKLIFSKDIGALNLVANPVLAYEREIGEDGSKQWKLHPELALGACYVLGRVTPGLEVSFEKNNTRVIPGLYIDVVPDVRLNLGVAFGSGSESNALEARSILELEF